MQCPRCQAPITGAPDASGALLCSSCGARLLTRAAAAARAAKPSEAGAAPEPPNPGATLPPGTPLRKIPKPDDMGDRGGANGGEASRTQFEAILAELRALRSVQEEILELIREGGRPGAGDGPPAARPMRFSEDDTPISVTPIRTKKRKSVILIDDDDATRGSAVAELEKAAVPVRAFKDGQAGLQGIAEDKPDVIALELDLRGAMAGKDVINMIKATMEWVDIPIVLYTRSAVENQREARTVHGADEVVPKSAGAAALVTRCVAFFRKG